MTFALEFKALIKEAVREVLAENHNPNPSTEGEFLSFSEAATLLGVSRGTIKRWVADGRLVAFGAGRVRRVKASDCRTCMTDASHVTPEKVDLDAKVMFLLDKGRNR